MKKIITKAENDNKKSKTKTMKAEMFVFNLFMCLIENLFRYSVILKL